MLRFLIAILFVTISLTAQNKQMILKANGEIERLNRKDKIKPTVIRSPSSIHEFGLSTLDTLRYDWSHHSGMSANFGFWGQDVILQWIQAPADMIIKAIGFSCSDDSGAVINNSTISLRLVQLDWDFDKLNSFYGSPTYLGYYPSESDSFNNITPFPNEATGEWVDQTNGEYPTPPWSEETYDIWSDDGKGFEIIPIKQDEAGSYQWVETSELGFEPEIQRASIIAVVAEHNGTGLPYDRIGFYADNTVEYPGMKFYMNGFNEYEPGWWIRDYTFDFALAVDLVSDDGCIWYWMRSVEVNKIMTSIENIPRRVEAKIPYDPECKLESVELFYSINNNEPFTEQMDSIGNDYYEAFIPPQNPGDEITYWVQLTSTENEKYGTQQHRYYIFAPTADVENLVIFNGGDPDGYPELYYFRKVEEFQNPEKYANDMWAYGALSEELVNSYSNIFEICLGGPLDYNREVIRAWLDADPAHNYFLSGMEWLGADNGYTDKDYSPGDFEYDVLGVKHSYNDVSYYGEGGQGLKSQLFPVAGSILTSDLFQFLENSEYDSLFFDPVYEVGFNNWIDGFEAVNEEEVQMYVETRGIALEPTVEVIPTLIARTYNSGNKIVFAGFDPISLNTGTNYFWIGDSLLSPQYQAMMWFNNITELQEETSTPKKFTLSQNYPNPFNPTTKIKYTIPTSPSLRVTKKKHLRSPLLIF